jgi:hypothetical protein
MRLPVEWVELRTEDRDLVLTALVGDSPATPSGGGGGWEAVVRPGRRPILVWRQPDEPYRIMLPLVIDGYAGYGGGSTNGKVATPEGRSVEDDIRVLERMAGVNVPGDPEPPLLIVEGSLPHDESRSAKNRYVIEKTPEWGNAIRRELDGSRVRQHVVLTLALYTEDDVLSRVRSSPRPSYRIVQATAKLNTYEKLAAKYLSRYGGRRLGSRLARLNGGRSGDKRLRHGTEVRLPTTDAAKKWQRELKKG